MSSVASKERYHLVAAETAVLVTQACEHIVAQLNAALNARGQASLMVSGGSSPKPLFAALANADIGWDKVTVSLVDERWVEPGEAGSNESFIKENFLQGAAASAKFISLKSTHNSVSEGLPEIEQRFEDVAMPFDICVMGMGTDSHTASWFPGAVGRDAAMNETNTARFASIDARGCEGAGEFPDRITLTLSAVMSSRDIILFIPGAQKAKVFDAARMGDEANTPVGALKSAGHRLTVFTGNM